MSENNIVWKDIKKGCLQGSICGPMVWNFMINDLLNELEENGFDVVTYADDVLKLIEGLSRRELELKGMDEDGYYIRRLLKKFLQTI